MRVVSPARRAVGRGPGFRSRFKTAPRRTSSAVVALAAVAALATVSAQPAAAATFVGGDTAHGLTWEAGNPESFWGNYKYTNSATLFYCADNTLNGPSNGGTYTGPTSAPTWTSDTGQVVPTRDLWKAGYLLDTYGQTTNKAQAAAVSIDLWTLIRSNGYNIRDASNKASTRANRIGIRPQALSLLDATDKFAGPYTATLAAAPAKVTEGKAVNATFTLKSAAGNPMPNVPVTISWPQGDPTSVKGTTNASGQFTGAFTAPAGTTSTTLTASTGAVLPGLPVFLRPSDSDAQRTMVAGAPVPASASATVATTPVVKTTPSVSTQTSNVVAAPGDSLHDIVKVTGGVPGAAFTGTSTLYGPLATQPVSPSATAPAGTPVVGTATFAGTYGASGNANVSTTALKIPASAKPGYYVWQEQLAGTATSNPVRGRFGVNTETSVVMKPTVATKVSAQKANVGDTISDTVTVGGIYTTVGGKTIVHTITGVLAGPVAPVNGKCDAVDWAKAKTRPITSLAITKNGDVTGVDEHTVTAAGCYSYGETLTSVLQGVTKPVSVVQHPVGQTPQTTVVAPAPPTISTQISTQTAMVGDTISDTVKASGLVLDIAGTPVSNVVHGVLAGPVAPVDGSCEGLDWAKAPASEIEPFEITQAGEVTLDGVAPTKVSKAGCYSYGETLLVFVGDDEEPTFTVEHPVGKVEQTVLVTSPPVPATPQARIVSGAPDTHGWNSGLLALGAGLFLVLGAGAAYARPRMVKQD